MTGHMIYAVVSGFIFGAWWTFSHPLAGHGVSPLQNGALGFIAGFIAYGLILLIYAFDQRRTTG